MFGIEGKEE
jgi:hypothetical protein